jgi:pyruvate/2-oxoglutarate/acetoin dehydrogenase E1 component
MPTIDYSSAIRAGFAYPLECKPEASVIGQGLWNPLYAASSIAELEREFGKDQVIDAPISEWSTTFLAFGASPFGTRHIVVHARTDLMIFATDRLVNQSAKWPYMLGGQANPRLTVRCIINRCDEQVARDSQSLQSWWVHASGLRAVMPYPRVDDVVQVAGACIGG